MKMSFENCSFLRTVAMPTIKSQTPTNDFYIILLFGAWLL